MQRQTYRWEPAPSDICSFCILQHEAATAKWMYLSFSFLHLPRTPPLLLQSEACAWIAGLWSRCLKALFSSPAIFLHAPLHCTERISKYSWTLKDKRQTKTLVSTHTLKWVQTGALRPHPLIRPAESTSVVFEQRQQVVVAVVWEVRGSKIRQQLIWIGQFRKKLHDTQKWSGFRKLNTTACFS